MRKFVPVTFALLALTIAAQADGISDANAGLDALNRHDYAKAISLFTNAIEKGKLAPSDLELAYAKRAQAYIGQKNKKNALADLDKAQKLDASDKDIADLRGQAQRIPAPAPPPPPPPAPPRAAPTAAPAPEPARAPRASSVDSSALDLAAWNAVKDSSDPRILQSYIDTYPRGVFATIARAKIAALKPAAPPPPVAAPAPPPAPVAASAAPVAAAVTVYPISNTHTAPPYPESARNLGEHGATILTVTVAPDGSVSSTSVQQSSGSDLLDQAAAKHVKANWRWRPPTRNGAAVFAVTAVSINWSLTTEKQNIGARGRN